MEIASIVVDTDFIVVWGKMSKVRGPLRWRGQRENIRIEQCLSVVNMIGAEMEELPKPTGRILIDS
jgi:hypothetical protein